MSELYVISATSCYMYSDDGACGGKLYTQIAYNSIDASKKLLECISSMDKETANVPSDESFLINKTKFIKKWKIDDPQNLEEAITYCKQYVPIFIEYLRSFEEFSNPGYDIQIHIIMIKNGKTTKYECSNGGWSIKNQ